MRVLFLVICLCQILCFSSKSGTCMESAYERWNAEHERIAALTPRSRAAHDAEQTAFLQEHQKASERRHVESMRAQVAAYDARKHLKDRSGSGNTSSSDGYGSLSGLASDTSSPGLGATKRALDDTSPPPQALPPPATVHDNGPSTFYTGDSNRAGFRKHGLADDGSEADDESDTGSSVGARSHRKKKSTTTPPSTTRADD